MLHHVSATNFLRHCMRQPHSTSDSSLSLSTSVISTACMCSISITPSFFHSRLKTYIFSNHSHHHRLLPLSTASCLLPLSLLLIFFSFLFLVIIFSVMVHCWKLSWLLSATERTINILYLTQRRETHTDMSVKMTYAGRPYTYLQTPEMYRGGNKRYLSRSSMAGNAAGWFPAVSRSAEHVVMSSDWRANVWSTGSRDLYVILCITWRRVTTVGYQQWCTRTVRAQVTNWTHRIITIGSYHSLYCYSS